MEPAPGCPSHRVISSPSRAPRRQTRTARDAPGCPKGGSGTARSSSRTRLVKKVGLKSTFGSFNAGSNRSLPDPLLPQVAAHGSSRRKSRRTSFEVQSPGCARATTTWSSAQRSGHVFPKFKSPVCVQAAATWSPAQRSGHVFSKFKVLAPSRQQRRGAPHSVAGTSFEVQSPGGVQAVTTWNL